jgi:hypothetical protein
VKVMAIDPGGAVGWALVDFQGKETLTLYQWGEARYHNTFFDRVVGMMQSGFLDHLVMEDFVPRKDLIATWQPDALHQIGLMKWWAWKTETPLTLQRVSDAHPYAKDKHKDIKRVPLQVQGGHKNGGHGLSALKHAIYFQGMHT